MKHLLTKLSGDHIWIPTSSIVTPDDISFFGDGRDDYRIHLLKKHQSENEVVDTERLEDNTAGEDTVINGTMEAQAGPVETEPMLDATTGEDDVVMVDVSNHNSSGQQASATESTEHGTTGAESAAVNGDSEAIETINSGPEPLKLEAAQNINGIEQVDTVAVDGEPKSAAPTNADQVAEEVAHQADDPDTTLLDPDVPAEDEAEGKEEADVPAPRRMRTRAQAQAASDHTERSRTRSLSNASNDSFVHPFFLAPTSSIPDRDFSLPAQEAEETRRLLQLFIQKQEEICRGSQKLYEGLLKADRLRGAVMKWAKAEAHTGENGMSDGEDWYDAEEWGLDGELKKGQDEEEEDAATTVKKTRTRRQ